MSFSFREQNRAGGEGQELQACEILPQNRGVVAAVVSLRPAGQPLSLREGLEHEEPARREGPRGAGMDDAAFIGRELDEDQRNDIECRGGPCPGG